MAAASTRELTRTVFGTARAVTPARERAHSFQPAQPGELTGGVAAQISSTDQQRQHHQRSHSGVQVFLFQTPEGRARHRPPVRNGVAEHLSAPREANRRLPPYFLPYHAHPSQHRRSMWRRPPAFARAHVSQCVSEQKTRCSTPTTARSRAICSQALKHLGTVRIIQSLSTSAAARSLRAATHASCAPMLEHAPSRPRTPVHARPRPIVPRHAASRQVTPRSAHS